MCHNIKSQEITKNTTKDKEPAPKSMLIRVNQYFDVHNDNKRCKDKITIND